MPIDNGNEEVFSLGDNTKRFRINDAQVTFNGTPIDGVQGYQLHAHNSNTWWDGAGCGHPLGGQILPSTGTTFTFPGPPTCPQHEVLDVRVEDGEVVGECNECGQKIIVDFGILNALSARILDRLAEVLSEKDVDKARVALGELGPEVREARATLDKIDRMMSMLERAAKVS